MPIRIRSKGCSIATTGYWLGTFATTEILPIAIENIGWKFFIVFTITNFSLVFICIPFDFQLSNFGLVLLS
jgi:hypothetical protein